MDENGNGDSARIRTDDQRRLKFTHPTLEAGERLAQLAWRCAHPWSFLGMLLLGGLVASMAGKLMTAAFVGLTLPILPVLAIWLGERSRRQATEAWVRSVARRAIVAGSIELAIYAAILAGQLVSVAHRIADPPMCQAKISHVGKGLQFYAMNHGRYPADLEALLIDAEMSAECFICPGGKDKPATGATTREAARNMLTQPGHLSYVYVGASVPPKDAPPGTVLLYEPLKNHDNEGANFLFADGDARWLDAAEAKYKISELQAGHNPPRPRSGAATRP